MRHKWTDDTCERCGITRALHPATSVRGCYGLHRFERLTYFAPNGRNVTSWDNPRKVPPCRPPREEDPK